MAKLHFALMHGIKIVEITGKFISMIGVLNNRTGIYMPKEAWVKELWKNYTETPYK